MVGQRLIKQTVLFDGRYAHYHLYYANANAEVGSVMTTFPYKRVPGRIGSGQIQAASYSEWIDDLLAPVRSTPVLVGHSLGTGAAVEYALRHPDRQPIFRHLIGPRVVLDGADSAASKPRSCARLCSSALPGAVRVAHEEHPPVVDDDRAAGAQP